MEVALDLLAVEPHVDQRFGQSLDHREKRCEGLPGRDSNPNYQSQNLACCQLHHPATWSAAQYRAGDADRPVRRSFHAGILGATLNVGPAGAPAPVSTTRESLACQTPATAQFSSWRQTPSSRVGLTRGECVRSVSACSRVP